MRWRRSKLGSQCFCDTACCTCGGLVSDPSIVPPRAILASLPGCCPARRDNTCTHGPGCSWLGSPCKRYPHTHCLDSVPFPGTQAQRGVSILHLDAASLEAQRRRFALCIQPHYRRFLQGICRWLRRVPRQGQRQQVSEGPCRAVAVIRAAGARGSLRTFAAETVRSGFLFHGDGPRVLKMHSVSALARAAAVQVLSERRTRRPRLTRRVGAG